MAASAATTTSPSAAPSTESRYRFLDLFRFAAAVAVLSYHYAFRGWAADGLSVVRFDEAGSVARYAFFGVHLFFIVSGFVIAASAERRRASEFVQARVRRLYPTFWVACLLSAAVAVLFAQPQFTLTWAQVAANLTLFAAELRQPYVDGAYWSLTVEVHFYAVVAAVIAAGQVRHLNRVLLAWLALSIVNLAHQLPGDWVLALQYAPLFAAGGAYSAIARRREGRLDWATIALAVPASAVYATRSAIDMSAHYHVSLAPLACAAIVLAFHGLFLAFVVPRTDLPPWRLLPVLGGVTYPLYLIHQNVGYMALNASAGRLGRHTALALVTIGVVALAWAIYAYAEPAVRRELDRGLAALGAWRVVRRARRNGVGSEVTLEREVAMPAAPVATAYSHLDRTEERLRAPRRRPSGEGRRLD